MPNANQTKYGEWSGGCRNINFESDTNYDHHHASVRNYGFLKVDWRNAGGYQKDAHIFDISAWKPGREHSDNARPTVREDIYNWPYNNPYKQDDIDN